MNAMIAPTSSQDLKRRIVEFARGSSTEISPHDEGVIEELAGLLPAGTTVYVAHTPKATLQDVVRIACRLAALGLRASPHIVARRIETEQALRAGLAQLRAAGVEQVLLVAGDRNPPAGEFSSTLEILDSGAITDAGITSAGVAGHPEGHPAVADEVVWNALAYKQGFAERTGLKMHIVSFKSEPISSWDRALGERGITLPVHVGVAGPTPLPKLIKYAAACGVGASLGALTKNMGLLGKLTGFATTPEEMLVGLVRGAAATPATHLVHPHFYAFGGVIATARWFRAVMQGAFELDRDDEKFTVRL